MIDLVINILLQTSGRCFTAHQCYVCYILYEIADNEFI